MLMFARHQVWHLVPALSWQGPWGLAAAAGSNRTARLVECGCLGLACRDLSPDAAEAKLIAVGHHSCHTLLPVGLCRNHGSSHRSSELEDRGRQSESQDRSSWEGASKRGTEAEWEMTPSRVRPGSETPGRASTGRSQWDYMASPAPSPVRAGSGGGDLAACLS